MKQVLVTTPDKYATLFEELAWEETVGLDTEAVGPPRRYTQARDKPFLNMGYTAIQGISLYLPEANKAYYLPLRHRKQNCKWLWAVEVMDLVSSMNVWVHNAKFDVTLLRKEGFPLNGIKPRDSMLAAWIHYGRSERIGLKYLAEQSGLPAPAWEGSLIDKTGAEVLDYVCADAFNTYRIGEDLWAKLTEQQQKWLVDVETPLAVLLGEMELKGIGLDLHKLQHTLGAVAQENLYQLKEEWDRLCPDLNYASSKDIQELFIDGTLKEYGRTKKGAFKTGKDVLEYNIKHGNAQVAQLLLDLRGAAKVKGTYVDGFYEELRQWPDRKLHPELLQMGTRTGRLASANPNIQNQLSKGEYAPLLKECYIPEDGHVFVSADYSQIELRLFADLCKGTLLSTFLEGGDLHQITADTLGVDRSQGKTFNFGFLIYGGGPGKAAREFGWTKEEAKERIAAIARTYPEAERFRTKVIEVVSQRETPFVRTKGGRIRWVPELKPRQWAERDPEAYHAKAKYLAGKYGMDPSNQLRMDRVIRASGERIAVNTIIQGSAADVAKKAIVDFSKMTDGRARVVTMVHDEILATSWEAHGEWCAALLKKAMEEAGPSMGYTVPLVAEPKIGKNWKAVH